MKRGVLLAAVAILIMGAVPAQALNLGIAGSWWSPGLSGQYGLDANGIPGTMLDMEDDLGMGDESLPSVEGFLSHGPHRLSLGYTLGEWEGRRVLARPLVFNGVRFFPGITADSELSLSMTDLTYTYRFLGFDYILAGLALEAGVRLKYVDGEESLASAGVTARKDFQAAIPELAVSARLGILKDLLWARVQAQGIAYGGNSLFEGTAELSLSPLPVLGLNVGYRFLSLDAEYDGFHLDMGLSGFYALAAVSF